MLKKLALIVVLAGFSWTAIAIAQDNSENRRAAAEKYADTINFEQMVGGTITQISQSLSGEERNEFIRNARKGIDIRRFRSITIDSMVQVFTVEELNLLAQFYGSPAGKSIIKKFPEYMGIAMPKVSAEIQRAVGE